jgi:hypothetical protein
MQQPDNILLAIPPWMQIGGNTHWVSSSMDSASPQQNAEVLLEDLKVIINKSKHHFNQNTNPKVNCGFEQIQEFYQRVVGQVGS